MDNNAIEQTYVAQNVAETLEIGRSTLNKYSRSLEECGYAFLKDDRGNRSYTEHDIVALRYVKSLLDKNVAYDKAMRATADKYGRIAEIAAGAMESDANPVTTAIITNSDTIAEEVSALRSEVAQLVELNRLLVQRLDDERRQAQLQLAAASESTAQTVNSVKEEYTALINELRSSQENRDIQIMAALKEMREERKQLAAAAEEERKKSWLRKLLEK